MTEVRIVIEDHGDFSTWVLSFGLERIASGTASGPEDAFEAAQVAAGEAFGLRHYPSVLRWVA